MSLLSIAQTIAVRVGLPKPTVAAAATDSNVQQIISFINEDGQELAKRNTWQALTNEATFTTQNAESQGSIFTLAGTSFVAVLNDTMWDRSTRRPVFGPKVPSEWQQLKAQFMQGPWSQYRIRGNQVLFIPPPNAGDAIFFEWLSNAWASTTAGVTSNALSADSDTALLDETVITLGALWRFKASKKLDYTEDFDKAEAAVADLIGRDASAPTLNLNGLQTDIMPGVFVPAGNWTL